MAGLQLSLSVMCAINHTHKPFCVQIAPLYGISWSLSFHIYLSALSSFNITLRYGFSS